VASYRIFATFGWQRLHQTTELTQKDWIWLNVHWCAKTTPYQSVPIFSYRIIGTKFWLGPPIHYQIHLFFAARSS